MATAPFLNGQSSPPPPPPLRPTKANKQGRGKKPNNRSNPKKTPQRGPGVAQLEMLRLQERCKMKEIESDNIQTQYQPISPAPVIPLGGYPVQWNYALGVPMISSGFGSSQGLVDPHCGSGAPERMMRFNDDDRHHHHRALESSKELSSIPNLNDSQSQSLLLDCCCNNASCYKKKRINQETDLGMMSDGDHFLGLSLESNFNNGRTKGFEQTSYKLNEGEEVVPVHRRARGIVGGNVVMEYDFLPENSRDRSTPSKQLPGNEGAAASHDAASGGSTGTSNHHVDLSLKLSF